MSTKRITTLVLVYDHPQVLLGLKKRGFGEGKWNGFGGKVLEGESIESAAQRECIEETGAEPADLEKRGVLHFFLAEDSQEIEMHVFHASKLNSEPKETEEMKPQWFTFDQIPFSQMWHDDLYWMPLFFQGKKFKGLFTFDEHNNVIQNQLEEVESLDL